MLSTGIVIHDLYTGWPMFANDLTLMSRLKQGLDSMLDRAHQDRELSIGGKKMIEKSVWHNLGKNWHTVVDSLASIIDPVRLLV